MGLRIRYYKALRTNDPLTYDFLQKATQYTIKEIVSKGEQEISLYFTHIDTSTLTSLVGIKLFHDGYHKGRHTESGNTYDVQKLSRKEYKLLVA